MVHSSQSELQRCLRVFGLKLGCTQHELRSVYFNRLQELHPDHNNGVAHPEFFTLQKAYEKALHILQNAHCNSHSTRTHPDGTHTHSHGTHTHSHGTHTHSHGTHTHSHGSHTHSHGSHTHTGRYRKYDNTHEEKQHQKAYEYAQNAANSANFRAYYNESINYEHLYWKDRQKFYTHYRSAHTFDDDNLYEGPSNSSKQRWRFVFTGLTLSSFAFVLFNFSSVNDPAHISPQKLIQASLQPLPFKPTNLNITESQNTHTHSHTPKSHVHTPTHKYTHSDDELHTHTTPTNIQTTTSKKPQSFYKKRYHERTIASSKNKNEKVHTPTQTTLNTNSPSESRWIEGQGGVCGVISMDQHIHQLPFEKNISRITKEQNSHIYPHWNSDVVRYNQSK